MERVITFKKKWMDALKRDGWIEAYQDPSSMPLTLAMEVADAFLQWLRDNGATISSKIGIKDYSDEGAGLGVVTLESIKKDEILFKIPRSCLLTKASTQHRTEIKKICKGAGGWISLMWAIILERLDGEESFWYPYFEILPKQPVQLPTTWSTAEQHRFLQGTQIEPFIADGSTQFRQHFLPHQQKFPQTAPLSPTQFQELFHFAGSLVSAYSFAEHEASASDAPAMVPLADTLNHRTGFNNARLYYERDHLVMIAFKDCAAGQQLFNTYGDLGNRELLLRYGFVDDPNPFHCVTLDLEWLAEFLAGLTEPSLLTHSQIKREELFERFEEQLRSEFNAQNLNGLLNWCHLLTLPLETPKKAIKPLKDAKEFLKAKRLLVKAVLEARLALYPKDQLGVETLPFGPERYAATIKAQDQEIIKSILSTLV